MPLINFPKQPYFTLVLIIFVLLLCSNSYSVASSTADRIWNDAQNGDLWSHKVNSLVLAAQVREPKATDRERVQIVNTTLYTDNGLLLRGEHLRIAELTDAPWIPGTYLERAFDIDTWIELAEAFNLNTVRLLLYRPPQNWGGGPGDNCPTERCFATVHDALPYIDAMIEIASDLGMYAIIDYHPVGGYDKDDASAWWNVLAPRYKNRTHVIYELSNEPVMWSAAAYGPDDIEFEEDLYQLIRGHAPDTHIILWSFAEASGDGDNMLTKVQGASGIDYGHASVGYHPYGNYNQNEMQALRDAGYPIMNTEIGGGPRDEYLNRTTTAENFGVSWIWLDGTGFNKPWGGNPLPVTWSKDPKSGKPTVAEPTISVGGNLCRVILRSATLGAEFRYSLDGSEPTQSSMLYTGPFALITDGGTTTVKVQAFKNKYNGSGVVSKALTIHACYTWLPTILKPISD